MKKVFILIVLMAIGSICLAAPVNNYKAIKKYRVQYTKLVVKREKEPDSEKRKQIKQQIDDFKAKNLHLFVR